MSSGVRDPKPLIAVCQVTSTPDREHNWEACSQLVREATRRDACLVFLPEAFDFIGSSTEETLSLAEPLEGDYLQRYVSLARECGVWLSLGGFHERGRDWERTQRIYNCHLLVDPKGPAPSPCRGDPVLRGGCGPDGPAPLSPHLLRPQHGGGPLGRHRGPVPGGPRPLLCRDRPGLPAPPPPGDARLCPPPASLIWPGSC